eukprot:TRINITY_DN32126_c0_g1_i1.p1 TRINITY_DN32126_c0_g1~~TRINITY_DN32126_c0_g1_i1.p1  ORF type:complete len:138 (+),score=53.88 TRINITY_DN32126_c0_g1_i1:54-467(+)
MYGGVGDDDGGRAGRFAQRDRYAESSTQQQVRKYDTHGLEVDEAIAREKAREARQIEAGVADIAQAQNELSALVKEQGVALDEAKVNIENARDKTGAGVGKLQSANKHARSERKWKCCAVIIALIVVVVVVIVFATK